MKKLILFTMLTFATVLSYAIPDGCYHGSRRRADKERCAIRISGDKFNVLSRSTGEVVASWTIVSDKNGVLTLKSEYGASATASWWEEDGTVYLSFNYEKFTRM